MGVKIGGYILFPRHGGLARVTSSALIGRNDYEIKCIRSVQEIGSWEGVEWLIVDSKCVDHGFGEVESMAVAYGIRLLFMYMDDKSAHRYVRIEGIHAHIEDTEENMGKAFRGLIYGGLEENLVSPRIRVSLEEHQAAIQDDEEIKEAKVTTQELRVLSLCHLDRNEIKRLLSKEKGTISKYLNNLFNKLLPEEKTKNQKLLEQKAEAEGWLFYGAKI